MKKTKEVVLKKLIKHDLGFYNNLVDKGFLLEPINYYPPKEGGLKRYSYPSGDRDVSKLTLNTKEKIQIQYNKSSFQSFCIMTGFADIEVIDVDNKVIKNIIERKAFNEEYFNLLDSHIENFYDKFCIVESQSGGFHILFKSKLVQPSHKVSKLKGNSEALIETRGLGGLIHIYNRIKGLEYHQIDYITDEDRKMLFDISKTYNHEEVLKPKVRKQNTIQLDGITPWDDYAEKNNVLDICSDDFDVVKHGKKSTFIRRKGADSAFSGYIFDDSGKMFLFSTGTIYPAETPLNSFDVYVFKYHKGDYSEATKQAYSDGYGARYKPTKEILTPITEVTPLEDVSFPLHILPESVQHYITECHNKLNASVDFMAVSYLWLMSVLIGNTLKVKVKNGWIDSPILWISVIGSAGVGKTPDIKLILKPLLDLNNQEIKRNIKRQKEYNEYKNLSKEDKEVNATLEEPVKTQMIVDDVTMEALIDMHSHNPKSLGIFKDELAGWFKDMNKYRDGSDKERFLSAWSGDSIVMNRRTVEDAFVENPFIPILGGIQPAVFKEFQTVENQSNGFMDRMLFCDPKKTAKYQPTEELSQELIDQYRDVIFKIKEVIDRDLAFVIDGVMESKIIEFSKEAKIEYGKSDRKLVDLINSEDELSNHAGMFSKQRTYIPRFALILEFVSNIYEDRHVNVISKKTIKDATELSNYFISMAKNNKIENKQNNTLSSFISKHKDKPIKELVKMMIKQFPNAKKKDLADSLDISRQTLHRYTK